MTPPASTPAPLATSPDTNGEGRVNQKRRTRAALIEAAISLTEEGREPTFAEVAERAMVSRATAYRYFSSVEALIGEAMFERAVMPLSQVYRAGDDPAEAIGRAARAMNQLLLADEVGLHVVERSFMSVWLDNPEGAKPARPGRRMLYIRPIVDALAGELDADERERLVHALSMVVGTEAAIAMRDIGGASVEQALDASAWAATALVRQAREAARARREAAGR